MRSFLSMTWLNAGHTGSAQTTAVVRMTEFCPSLRPEFVQQDFLFFWLHQFLVAACAIFHWGMWDLALWPGIKPRPPALEAESSPLDQQGKSLSSWILIIERRSLSYPLLWLPPTPLPFQKSAEFVIYSQKIRNICYTDQKELSCFSPKQCSNLHSGPSRPAGQSQCTQGNLSWPC